jgi:hypothetical protein
LLSSSLSSEVCLPQPLSTTTNHKLIVTPRTIADRIDLPLRTAAERLAQQDRRPDPEAAFDQLTRQCTLPRLTAHARNGSPLQLQAAMTELAERL